MKIFVQSKFQTVKWICPDRIKPTEKVDPIKASQIANELRKTFTVKAISVCSRTHAIIDGNHRFIAMRSLGLSQIPVCEVDYACPSLEVITSLPVTKEMIASGREVFPRKSLIHYYRDGPHIETRMPTCELPQNQSFRPSLSHLLRTGADSRISNKTTRYGTNGERRNAIQLGSCTASELTEKSYQLAESTLVMNSSYSSIMGDIKTRLRKYFDLSSKVGVFLTPCGTSAEIIPPLILRSRNVSGPCINILTMSNETGSGSSKAAGLLPWDHRCADGSLIDEPICTDIASKTTVINISARNEDGSPKNQLLAVQQILREQPDAFIIRHVVVGSKTGLSEDPLLAHLPKDRTAIVVDACQGRASKKNIQEWVNSGMFVLFTGSKFFQAPPFCGAVFVPPCWTPGRFTIDIGRLGSYFDSECVESAWKQHFPSTENWGLATRWAIALSNMEEFDRITPDSRLQIWREAYLNMLSSIEGVCIHESTDPTIICFSLFGSNFAHLQNIHRSAVHNGVILGQPVQITSQCAVLRLAFGVNDALVDLDAKVLLRVYEVLVDVIEAEMQISTD